MFSAGTRVYVHSSSITGKKMGPKRHSLGFISASDAGYMVKYVKDFPIKDQKFFLTATNIVFTRYGKGEKERQESRGILNITPIYSGAKKTDFKSKITEVLKIFLDGELSSNPFWTEMAKNYGPGNDICGIVLPVGNAEHKEMSIEQVKGWLLSILNNPNFQLILGQNTNLPTLKALAARTADQELPHWLRNACKGGTPRKDLFRWLEDAPSNLNKLVHCLKGITTTFDKRKVDASMNWAHHLFNRGKGMDTHALLSWVLYGIFDDLKLYNEKVKIIDNKHFSHETNNIVKHMGTVCDILSTFKPKHI